MAALALATLAHAQDTERMDRIVRQQVDARRFMGSVLVAKGDQIVFDKAYGSANLEWDVANTPTTKYRIGSITKQFTAASILLLEERGKLKVDDPVKNYFAEAPAAWDGVALKHLLSHTSGIPNFTSFPEFAKLKQFQTVATELINLFKDKPLDFAPGEKWDYSNSGYELLGYVVEKASGMSYAERFFVKEVDAQWEFLETNGTVTHVVLYQNGRETKAPRISDTVAVRREIALPASALQQYVGTYQLRPGFDLVVQLEGEQLVLHPTGQGADPLYAETADTFFSKVVDATIQFHRNGQGAVTHLTLNQGSFTGDAQKK